MTTPCDLAWGHLHVDTEIPPLTTDSEASAWKPAMEIRRKFMELLLSHPSFLRFPGTPQEQEYIDELARKVLAQGADQVKKFTNSGEPNSYEKKTNVLGTLTGSKHNGRPFAALMAIGQVESTLHAYMINICTKMVRAAPTAQAAEKNVYLIAKFWHTLDPLRRAQGVLEAHAYFGYIQLAHHVSQPAFPAPPYVAHSLPSLTARQARRSAVSERELRERWA
ncbi:hypothetical protein BCR35DRAFT_334412 [Leucosporidium creatinivorum]|uniref:Uncharacterized protein n=1 Tax=Leucosporidium creatinivorum TaxID=106004 RepID=A0A1Y2E903_9BASI|nr:hypothetical protein BCR35DRAFT_334412 [Leucosporidium creatinivorum]